MDRNQKTDNLWSYGLMVLPVAALILLFVPGMVHIYSPSLQKMETFSCMGVPAEVGMYMTSRLFLFLFGYTLIQTVIYSRCLTKGTARGLFVMSVVCLCMSLLVVLLDVEVEPWPLGIFVILWAVQSIAAFVRMKMEEDACTYD